jgi:hypothetical protein
MSQQETSMAVTKMFENETSQLLSEAKRINLRSDNLTPFSFSTAEMSNQQKQMGSQIASHFLLTSKPHIKSSATPAPLSIQQSKFLSRKLNHKSALGYIKGLHFHNEESAFNMVGS